MIFEKIDHSLACSIERGSAVRERGPAEDAQFDALAREVFSHQYEHVPLYRRLCDLRAVSPASVRHWSEIPAAPADLFKEDLGMPIASGHVTFLSSGTTAGAQRRSRHAISPRSLELYRASSTAHFRSMVLPDAPGPMAVLVLGPAAATHPSSSLGRMYDFVADAFGTRDDSGRAETAFVLGADGTLNVAAAIDWLQIAASGTRPVLLLALSSSMTALFEELRSRKLALRLPADSRLVDTGGSKGGRTFSRGGILHAAWRFLHIPAYLCTQEYGMTELLSQFYDDAWRSRWSGKLGPRAKMGPAWTRTMVVDPATLAPVPRGQRGILRHFDLANCESISAVQTLDLGIELGEGFEVLGRIQGAEARGCSQLMSMLSADVPGSDGNQAS